LVSIQKYDIISVNSLITAQGGHDNDEPMDITRVSRLVTQGRYEFSEHAERERIHDEFSVRDVKEVAICGELLEDYPGDQRGPNCLMLGWAQDGSPIHAVLTILPTEVVRFITVYKPTAPKWVNPRTRARRLEE
jgi:hypothetical protein